MQLFLASSKSIDHELTIFSANINKKIWAIQWFDYKKWKKKNEIVAATLPLS